MSDFDTLPASPDQARTFLTEAEGELCTTSSWSGSTLDYSASFAALRDAQLGTGHATLAVCEELAKLREGLADIPTLRTDLASIATAVKELTGAITPAEQPVDLVDLSNDVADVRTEVANIADAVRELADAIRTQQQPRRRWFLRCFGGDA